VVQTALVGIADIHPGAFPDGFEPLEFIDLGGVVFFEWFRLLGAVFPGVFFAQIFRTGAG